MDHVIKINNARKKFYQVLWRSRGTQYNDIQYNVT